MATNASARPPRRYYQRHTRNVGTRQGATAESEYETDDENSIRSNVRGFLAGNTNRLQSYDIIAQKCGLQASDLKNWAKIKRLKSSCTTYQNVATYIKNSQANYNVVIQNIYNIQRKRNTLKPKWILKNWANFYLISLDELEPFDPRIHRMILWHGTKPNCVGGIIQNGFKTGLGGLYGSGIYFADRFAKSAGYCGKTVANTAFLFLTEVDLGRVYKAHHTHGNYTSAPLGFHTVKGNGQQVPRWRQNVEYHGAIMPIGVSSQNPRHPSYNLGFNEYIVYDPKRIIVRMLVECTF